MSLIRKEPITGPAAWKGVDLAGDTSWLHPLSAQAMATLLLAEQIDGIGEPEQAQALGLQALITDNGQHILDVRGLQIRDPLAFESEVNQWPGVVTVGVFAHQKAQVCLLGTSAGVETLEYPG